MRRSDVCLLTKLMHIPTRIPLRHGGLLKRMVRPQRSKQRKRCSMDSRPGFLSLSLRWLNSSDNTKPSLTATNGQGRFPFRLNTISPRIRSPKGSLLRQEQTCDCSPGLSHGQRLWYADIPDLFCSSRFSSKFPRCRRINIRFLAW